MVEVVVLQVPSEFWTSVAMTTSDDGGLAVPASGSSTVTTYNVPG